MNDIDDKVDNSIFSLVMSAKEKYKMMKIWIKIMIRNDHCGLLYQKVIDRYFTQIVETQLNIMPYLQSQIVMHKIENVDYTVLSGITNFK
jgi:hypothetical protein